MVYEGEPGSELVEKGLAVTRAVHDRYAADRRNPYNEIECGDHYARSMASYGVFLAACGFEYHGPKGTLGFAPRLSPDDFKAPFTTAEGWGTFSQTIGKSEMNAEIAVNWGSLKLQTIRLDPQDLAVNTVSVMVEGKALNATLARTQIGVSIELPSPVIIASGQVLKLALCP